MNLLKNQFYQNNIVCGNCLEIMPKLANQSVDLILTDLPYGQTQNSWDQIIDIDQLWQQYKRIITPNGSIVLTSAGSFSAKLIIAGIDLYKYSLVWKKNNSRGFLNAKKQPLRSHEDILVFYKNQNVYNPQKSVGHKAVHSYSKPKLSDGSNYGSTTNISGGGSTERYPTSIIEIAVASKKEGRFHPTQKPLALGEYLVKTYSNPEQVILDNACGSGTFLIAAKKLNRNFIGIDLLPQYVETTQYRLSLV